MHNVSVQPVPRPKMIIIGGGMSGTKFAMRMAEHQLFDICILNDEPDLAYNRIMLSPLLAGEQNFTDIQLHEAQEYLERGIDVRSGCAVVKIDTQKQQVHCSDGSCLNYDKLVLACGSRSRILDIENNTIQGVLGFRSKQDVDQMLTRIQLKKNLKCIVIGAGLLGLEAAHGLQAQGADVTVVQRSEHILNQQLNATPASMLQRRFEQQGIKFILNAQTKKIISDEHHCVSALELADNQMISADLIVMAVGVIPNVEVAQQAGITCERGILVDNKMRCSVPNVYAIGECVQFRQSTFGLLASVFQQAQVLEDHLCGGSKIFELEALSTKLKVSGVNLFSVGDISDDSGCQFLSYIDEHNNIYRRLSLRDQKIVGAVMYGDVSDALWYFELLSKQQNIANFRQQLLFGEHYCPSTDETAPCEREESEQEKIQHKNKYPHPIEVTTAPRVNVEMSV